MSYILDALKRAERERKLGQVSVLDEVQSAPAGTPSARRPRPWLWLGLGALLSGLAVYALIGWGHRSAPAKVPAAAAPAPAAAPGGAIAPAAAPPVAPAAASAAAPPAPIQQTPLDAAQRRAIQLQLHQSTTAGSIAAAPGTAPASPAAGAPPRAATIEDSSAIASVDDLAARAPARAAAAAQPVAHPSAATGGAAPAAAPPAAAPQTGGTATQQLKEMPDDYRSQFPQFALDVVAYNEDPARRFVLIDNKRYKEGDTLPQGPRIVAILAQGVVFDWQGRRVLYAGSR